MTDEVFLMLWQEAASRHPDGKVRTYTAYLAYNYSCNIWVGIYLLSLDMY